MDRFDEWTKLAADRLNSGDTHAAEKIARELLAAAPRHINALRLMGAVTRAQGKLEESLDYFRAALALNERKGLLHFELGTAFTELQRNEEAYDCYLKAVRLDPTLQPAFVNLSAVMEQQERFEEAIAWAEKAIALKPECGLSHYNLANALRELGRLPAAIESYEKAIRFKPDRAKTLWNLGICHLLAGDFREGWRLFECRQDAQEVFFDRYTQPRWDGSSLADKTIVVHAEQGIGDEILFASCFPDLIPLARQCILICDPRLERLLARSFPQAIVQSHLRRKDWSPPPIAEPFDVQIPAGSLPLHFRSSREQFPRRERFLEVDPRLLATWRERLAAIGPGLKIGISWRAGGKPVESRKRTVPLDHWGEIFAIPGTRFVNLQYGDASAEIAAARARFGVEIHDWEEADPLIDVDSFAAKIAALDLVISVGNATVHIAGAVGTPAWTLLPMVPSWRWMIAGEESPWYANVRLYRQPQPGDWGSVLERIARMLRERVGAKSAETTSVVNPASHAAATPGGESHRRRRWLGATELAGHKTEDLVARALQEGERLVRAGDMVEAEKRYREVIQLAPRHYLALNGLGIVARLTGRTELAIRSFRRSLAMIEALPEQQLNLADALADAARFDEALACYRRAIELDPTHVPARLQAGRMLERLRRHGEAIAAFQDALAIQPHDATALVELGRCLAASGRIDEAIAHLEHAAELRPDSAEIAVGLGSAYFEDQRYAEAETSFRRATRLDATLARAQIELAHTLEMLGRRADAAEVYEQVIALDSGNSAAMMQLAMLRRGMRQLDAAAALLRRARAVRPADSQILNSLGVVLHELGADDDALDCFDDALQFAPDYAEAHVNRAFALLRTARLAEGWQEYEWRWKCPQAGAARSFLTRPAWDGGPLAGKTILVHGEQGLADELMFASCYPDVLVQAPGAAIICDPRLETLLRRSFPRARVCAVARGREQQWKLPADLKIDVQIPAGSLPRLLRPTRESFPQRRQYLVADPATVEARRQTLAHVGGGLKIGIALGDGGAEGESLGCPAGELFQSLAGVANLEFVLLSAESPAAAISERAAAAGLRINRWPASAHANDVDELASRIAALDLVIGGSGLIPHLAGALGKPSWVLLPRVAEWFWMTDGESPLWYSSVRLFRQQRPDDWTNPLKRLRGELLDLARQKSDRNGMSAISGPHWAMRAATEQMT